MDFNNWLKKTIGNFSNAQIERQTVTEKINQELKTKKIDLSAGKCLMKEAADETTGLQFPALANLRDAVHFQWLQKTLFSIKIGFAVYSSDITQVR